MKLYIKRVEGTHPLGVTTKSSDKVEWYNGYESADKVLSTKLKGTSVFDRLTIPKSHKTNEFVVWAKEPQPNPYFEDENAKIGDNWISAKEWILKQKVLPEQTIAEIKFDCPKGFLTEKCSWGDKPNQRDSKKTYLETLWKHFADTNTFDDENGTSPMNDYIWIRAILRSSKEFVQSDFAPSKAEIAKKPNCKYFIYDEKKEQTEGFVKVKPKLKVSSYLYKVTEDYNQEQCYKLASMIAAKYTKAVKPDRKLTETKLKNWLVSFTEEKTSEAEQLERWRLFVEVYDRMNDKTKAKAFDHEFFINECIKERVLIKNTTSPDYGYYVDGNRYEIGSMDILYKLTDKAILEVLDGQLKAKLINA